MINVVVYNFEGVAIRSKFGHPKKVVNILNILKFEECGFYHEVIHLKDAEGMKNKNIFKVGPNSVDPDQTSPEW